MGLFDFVPTGELHSQFNEAIDLAINLHDRPCKLYYIGTKFKDCPSCQTDSVSVDGSYNLSFNHSFSTDQTVFHNIARRGSSAYYHGSPAHFYNTAGCPNCNGDGRILVENSETVRMAVIWSGKSWFTNESNVKIADGQVETVCNKDLVYKLKQSEYVIFNTDIENVIRYKYQLDGEPQPCGFGDDRYMISRWMRI